jgi:septum formation protein
VRAHGAQLAPDANRQAAMLYLASASPRRRQLLQQLGIGFEVIVSDLEEVRAPDETPPQYVLRVALEKARWAAADVRKRGLPPRPVLAADTEVVLDGDVLGKPMDREHGLAMLQRLQGRTHEVLSIVALLNERGESTALSRSAVTFAPMTQAQIERYWESGEPAGKAGGYAIQGRAAAFIVRLEGSYSGVMGLPLYETAQLLRQAGLLLRE